MAAVADEAAEDGEDGEAIDEITVMGVRDLGALRTELMRMEDEVYGLYNDLNEDDRFDIICKREAPIGSQIKKRTCLSRMFRDSVADATEFDEQGVLHIGTVINEKKHMRILMDNMRTVANKNPQLNVALKKRYALEQKLNQEREKKFGDD
jgi:hypothetical protein